MSFSPLNRLNKPIVTPTTYNPPRKIEPIGETFPETDTTETVETDTTETVTDTVPTVPNVVPNVVPFNTVGVTKVAPKVTNLPRVTTTVPNVTKLNVTSNPRVVTTPNVSTKMVTPTRVVAPTNVAEDLSQTRTIHLYSDLSQIVEGYAPTTTVTLLGQPDLSSIIVMDVKGNSTPLNIAQVEDNMIVKITTDLDFSLSYLTRQLYYTRLANIIVQDSDKNEVSMVISLVATIINKTLMPITAVMICSTKSINMEPEIATQCVVKSTVSCSAELENQTQEYNIGLRTIDESLSLELESIKLVAARIYVYYTNTDKVWYGYKGTSPSSIPSSKANVYETVSAEIGTFTTTTAIEETMAGERLIIITGKTSLLQCQSKVTSTKTKLSAADIAKLISTNKVSKDSCFTCLVTETLSLTITNYNTKATKLLVRHNIANQTIITITPAMCSVYNSKYLEWWFDVPTILDCEPYRQTICYTIKYVV